MIGNDRDGHHRPKNKRQTESIQPNQSAVQSKHLQGELVISLPDKDYHSAEEFKREMRLSTSDISGSTINETN